MFGEKDNGRKQRMNQIGEIVGFIKKQLHECMKFLNNGVFKNQVKLERKTQDSN